MTDLEKIFQTVDELNSDEFQRLYDYILKEKLVRSKPSSDSPRIPGLHAHLGKAWMSDDFNDPFPDEFWLGEE